MKNVNQLNTSENSAVFYNPSDFINNYKLVANTAQTVTIPTGASLAVFAPAIPFYADFSGATAAVPAANITDGTSPSFSPATRYVKGLSTFSIISAQAGNVTIEFYTL